MLTVLAAVVLPVVASVVESVRADAGNLILLVHLLLIAAAGAALGAVTTRSRRGVILGALTGAVAALLADFGWALAIAG